MQLMAENRYFPVIIVPGLGQSRVVETDASGSAVRSVWPPDLDKDLLIGRMKGPFMKMMLFRRDAGFSDAAAGLAAEMMDGVSVNPDGSMRHTVKAVTFPRPLSECGENEKRFIYKAAPVQRLAAVIGEENVFFFGYNPFALPYEAARELHEFAAMVKRRTGSEKLNFMPLSQGGALFTAYLDAYGGNDVHRIVYFAPALRGAAAMADIFGKKVIPEKAGTLLGVLVGENAVAALGSLTAMLPDGVLASVTEKTLDTVLKNLLTGSGAVWACMPPADYPAYAETYLSDAAHAPLKAQTDRYFAAQSALPETLRALAARGVGIYICAGYGRSLPAGLENAACSSDGMIDVYSASLGAAAAAPGRKLPEDRIKNKAYLSPDGALDASAGAFPESTWYFYDRHHDAVVHNDVSMQIALLALSDETFTDIHSVPSLGQFQ